MTRSITIVNTSNWDGEDYEIVHSQGHVSTILVPGESVKLDSSQLGQNLSIEKCDSPEIKPKPFYLNDEQVFPKVFVRFEKA